MDHGRLKFMEDDSELSRGGGGLVFWGGVPGIDHPRNLKDFQNTP